MAYLTALHFEGSDWYQEPGDFTPPMREALYACCHPGKDAADDVAAFRELYAVTGNEDDCRAYLAGYGAWSDDELEDHDTNLSRLVWLTACGLKEGSASFSTY